MTRVSVIIAAFNVAGSVDRAIHSALDQESAGVLEVIVSDDASSDTTADVVRALAAADGRVRLVRAARNAGPGAARALALASAQGEWVAVLDADDTMAPERLALLIDRAEEEKLDLIADNLMLVDPYAGPVGRAFPVENGTFVPLTAARVLMNSIPGGRVNLGWMKPVVRRAFLTHHTLSWRPLRHGEDMVFTLEVLLAGARAALVGTALYKYTQRRGAVSGRTSSYSRTRRDAAEQIRAIETLERVAGDHLDEALHRRLKAMRGEIGATQRVLNAQDHFDHRRIFSAAAAATGGLLRHPVAFGRCVLARFGPNSRRIV